MADLDSQSLSDLKGGTQGPRPLYGYYVCDITKGGVIQCVNRTIQAQTTCFLEAFI